MLRLGHVPQQLLGKMMIRSYTEPRTPHATGTFVIQVLADPTTAHNIAIECPGCPELFADVSAHAPTALYFDLFTIPHVFYPDITEQIVRRDAALDFWLDRLAQYYSEGRMPLDKAEKESMVRKAKDLRAAHKKTGWVPGFLELIVYPVQPIQIHELWEEHKRGMFHFQFDRFFRPKGHQ